MAAVHRRHDISDQVWEGLRPLLPGDGGKRGRPARDNRLLLNAVFWILCTGAPWRDLPPDYGDWKNTPDYSLWLLPLAGTRRLRVTAGCCHRRSRFRMADDRRQLRQGPSTWDWSPGGGIKP